MKIKFPKYGIGEIRFVEKTLDKHNKKIIDDFIILCGGTAGKATLTKIRRNMVKIWDVFEKDLDTISLDDLRKFLGLLNQSKLLPPTKNEVRKILKRFLREKYDDWSLKFKRLKDIKTEKELNQNKINGNTIFKKSEVEALIRGCETLRYKAMFMLFYESAGRPEEVEKLKWKDIDLGKREVTLTSSKTGNVRINPLQDSIIHLKRYKQEYPFPNVNTDDFIFPSPYDREKRITNTSVDIYFKKLGKRVLGRDVWPYLLRHTRATELQKVLPAKIYEKFMDHSIETATRYSHLNKEDVREAMLSKVYEIEELTEEDRNKLKELEEKIKSIKKILEKVADHMKRGVQVVGTPVHKIILTKEEENFLKARAK